MAGCPDHRSEFQALCFSLCLTIFWHVEGATPLVFLAISLYVSPSSQRARIRPRLEGVSLGTPVCDMYTKYKQTTKPTTVCDNITKLFAATSTRAVIPTTSLQGKLNAVQPSLESVGYPSGFLGIKPLPSLKALAVPHVRMMGWIGQLL